MTAVGAFYVCAGICRVDPDTDCCIGCGRPVDPAPSSSTTSASRPSLPEDGKLDLAMALRSMYPDIRQD